jgi:hypothetical protein
MSCQVRKFQSHRGAFLCRGTLCHRHFIEQYLYQYLPHHQSSSPARRPSFWALLGEREFRASDAWATAPEPLYQVSKLSRIF